MAPGGSVERRPRPMQLPSDGHPRPATTEHLSQHLWKKTCPSQEYQIFIIAVLTTAYGWVLRQANFLTGRGPGEGPQRLKTMRNTPS
eukprot:2533024-Pyramimonas_sp.AAC.2